MFSKFNKKIYWLALKITFEKNDIKNKDNALLVFDQLTRDLLEDDEINISLVKKTLLEVYNDVNQRSFILDDFMINKNYIIKNSVYLF